jgi:hypothetical protein
MKKKERIRKPTEKGYERQEIIVQMEVGNKG